MNFSLRILTAEDLPAYKALRRMSLKESPYAFSDSYEDEMKRTDANYLTELTIVGKPPEWFFLGAFFEQQELAGFVKFRRDLRLKGRHKSMVHAMYVDPKFRNQGVGKILMEEIISRAKSLDGLEQIHLWVLHFKDSASGFYQKLGFIPQGPRVKKDLKVGDDYVDAMYLVLYL